MCTTRAPAIKCASSSVLYHLRSNHHYNILCVAVFALTMLSSSNFALAFVGPTTKSRRMTRVPPTRTLIKTSRTQNSVATSYIQMEKDPTNNSDKQNNTKSSYTLRRSTSLKMTSKLLTLSSIMTAAFFPLVASAAPLASLASFLASSAPPTPESSYHLTRILFLRLLAIVYTSAFSVAKFQNKGLIGDHGITPAKKILNDAQTQGDLKFARRNEWISTQRNQYTTTANNTIILKLKTKLSDSRPAQLFREKFWYRTDRMDRPLPTLLWLASPESRNNHLNPWLDGLANVGLFLSTIMLATGSANVVLLLGLYAIQRSLMSVGGAWYGYGWEPQLAELTFHAIFLVPLLSMNPFFGWGGAAAAGPGAFPVPIPIIWAIRWYLFKIMLGAGLIKVKSSDPKWKPGNMSAMDYFYETQPVPNPFTRYFHFAPKTWHRFEVWSNHFVELVFPFLLLVPFRKLRLAGGLIQIMFQLVLISSGNLSFLNWLTMVPALFCLDDAFLMNKLPPIAQKIALGSPITNSYIESIASGASLGRQSPMLRTIISTMFVLLMAKLNSYVVKNLLSRRQLMNASFDKLRLCSSYGAFGVVAETREELIIESADNIAGPWKEYHFRVKPGDINRRPPWISPYHYRLDWQMWIASQCGRVERSPWMYNFLLQLLRQEKDVIGLLESDPWASQQPISATATTTTGDNDDIRSDNDSESEESKLVHGPKYIRVEKYIYKFYNNKNGLANNSKCDEGIKNHQNKSQYWIRQRKGRYFPRQGIMTAEMLEELANGR